MSSIRSELFGNCKYVQIPIGNKARVQTILVDKGATTRTDGNFCYVIYSKHESPNLDSYKKMGIAFNYFPDSFGQFIVTVRFSNKGKLMEETYSMLNFIINPFELTDNANEATVRATHLVREMNSGWENQVENGNLYSVSKLMED